MFRIVRLHPVVMLCRPASALIRGSLRGSNWGIGVEIGVKNRQQVLPCCPLLDCYVYAVHFLLFRVRQDVAVKVCRHRQRGVSEDGL